MRLFEHQAKRIYAENGIPVPRSVLTESKPDIARIKEEIGFPCVLKLQTLTGGRGKAGLIRIAHDEAEFSELYDLLWQRDNGLFAILVEECVKIAQELYLSVTVDPVAGYVVLLGCAAGGMDIETLAAEQPEKIVRECIDVRFGLRPYQANDFAYRMGLRGASLKEFNRIAASLYGVFDKMDASLAEINPLFLTEEGSLVAGDAKLILDDNAMYRHPEFSKTRQYYSSDMEFEAAQLGIPYVQFEGDVSLMCAGAGLTNTVYDMIIRSGAKVASYLEFGGPNYRKTKDALRITLQNQSKVILMVSYGSIARADVIAEDIAAAIREKPLDRPLVTALRGVGEERAKEILAEVGLEWYFDTEDAVRRAVELAGGGDEK